MPIQIPDACRDLLARQAGVIGRRQAVRLGLREDSVETLLRTGRWQRMQRGVYASFTGEPCRAAVLWGILLRAGPDAVLSHQTAAELYRLIPDPGDPIHVVVPRASRPGQIPGVIVHRVDRARQAGHPSLLPPRTRIEETVLDLAAAARCADEAFGWLFRATGQRLTTAVRLRAVLSQRSKIRWRAQLLGALDGAAEGVQSSLEHRYVRDVERPHGLPWAARQVRVLRDGQRRYLDNLYEEFSVGVELDGRAAHPAGERWRDYRRDNAGAADGIITLRYGWADVTGQPCAVAAQVAAVLRRRGWEGTTRRCTPSCDAPA